MDLSWRLIHKSLFWALLLIFIPSASIKAEELYRAFLQPGDPPLLSELLQLAEQQWEKMDANQRNGHFSGIDTYRGRVSSITIDEQQDKKLFLSNERLKILEELKANYLTARPQNLTVNLDAVADKIKHSYTSRFKEQKLLALGPDNGDRGRHELIRLYRQMNDELQALAQFEREHPEIILKSETKKKKKRLFLGSAAIEKYREKMEEEIEQQLGKAQLTLKEKVAARVYFMEWAKKEEGYLLFALNRFKKISADELYQEMTNRKKYLRKNLIELMSLRPEDKIRLEELKKVIEQNWAYILIGEEYLYRNKAYQYEILSNVQVALTACLFAGTLSVGLSQTTTAPGLLASFYALLGIVSIGPLIVKDTRLESLECMGKGQLDQIRKRFDAFLNKDPVPCSQPQELTTQLSEILSAPLVTASCEALALGRAWAEQSMKKKSPEEKPRLRVAAPGESPATLHWQEIDQEAAEWAALERMAEESKLSQCQQFIKK